MDWYKLEWYHVCPCLLEEVFRMLSCQEARSFEASSPMEANTGADKYTTTFDIDRYDEKWVDNIDGLPAFFFFLLPHE